MASAIRHIFVLMLENRSFDHMLGFSRITGTDAQSGKPTAINGLDPISLAPFTRSLGVNAASAIARQKGLGWPPSNPISMRDLVASNTFNGQVYRPSKPAKYAMSYDPPHEFLDVVDQLCGPGVRYISGGAYPEKRNSGFVDAYVHSGARDSPGEIMKCYSADQLPVLNRLAAEFVVCDNWYSSMPGPTWPNRFFAHAASSGGLDYSPDPKEIGEWELPGFGFSFHNGTIFDRLNRVGVGWKIYAGDLVPVSSAVKGIRPVIDILGYERFAADVSKADYPNGYTFIEPNYDALNQFRCGTSDHPPNDVTRGEHLIKSTYEAIRNSPVWNNSLLIIAWDEHGGFYDHMPPPRAMVPGDTSPGSKYNHYGFGFDQYGVRVPAVVVSPLIPRNIIDHRLYDHSSILSTVEACFGLKPPLTTRDADAKNLMTLVSLAGPRADTPASLPAPAHSGVGGCDPVNPFEVPRIFDEPIERPDDPVNDGNLPMFVLSASTYDLTLSPPGQRDAIVAKVRSIRTRSDAARYITEVEQKILAARDKDVPVR